MTLLPALDPRARASTALGRVMDPAAIPAAIGGLSSHDAAALLARDNPPLAIRLIAGWLSTREAVWFAALGLAQVRQAGADTGSNETFQRVLRWVVQPDAGISRELGTEALGQSPVSMLAAAVMLCGDSISPDPKHPVAPRPGLSHRMAAMAILSAASLWPASSRAQCLDHLVRLGLDVAECLHLWQEKAIPYHQGLRSESARTYQPTTRNIWENWK
jgi:hypothetical protein